MAGKKPIENVDYMLARQQIKQRIQAIIEKAIKLNGNHYYKTICKQFLNCVEPEKVPGTNPLPLIANSFNRCHVRSKYECMLYMISHLVQYFHKLTPTNSLTRVMIKEQLRCFEKLLSKGLNSYEVQGSKYPGYYLQEK